MKFYQKAIFSSILIFSLGLSSNTFAFSGLFSCSSGMNNDKPVTYMFNEKLMLRNDNKTYPFELVGKGRNGGLIYLGYAVHLPKFWQNNEEFETAISIYLKSIVSLVSSDLRRPINSAGKYFIRTKTDYLLSHALACDRRMQIRQYQTLPKNEILYQYITEVDKSDVDISQAQDCSWVLEYTKQQGITDIVEFMTEKRKQQKIDEATKLTSIIVDLERGRVWETVLYGSLNGTQVYNCTILDIDIPDIEPSEKMIVNPNSV